VAGKIWGTTQQLHANQAFELHRLEIDGGHRCSRHYHQAKHNLFFVESGAIMVSVWQPEKFVADFTTLVAGQSLIVPPGHDHMFCGVAKKSIVFEAYWAELRGDDIVRKNSGE
jgi:mannose-6-phosphate isomerase-like protein (cupin superfamily)